MRPSSARPLRRVASASCAPGRVASILTMPIVSNSCSAHRCSSACRRRKPFRSRTIPCRPDAASADRSACRWSTRWRSWTPRATSSRAAARARSWFAGRWSFAGISMIPSSLRRRSWARGSAPATSAASTRTAMSTSPGALKEIINRGGEKISPVEIDLAIESLPGVKEAAAFGIPHPSLGEEMVAAVVREENAAIDEAQVVEHVRARAGARKVPRRVYFVERLPRTEQRQVARGMRSRELLSLEQGAAAPSAESAAAGAGSLSPLEGALAGLWSSLLQVDHGRPRRRLLPPWRRFAARNATHRPSSRRSSASSCRSSRCSGRRPPSRAWPAPIEAVARRGTRSRIGGPRPASAQAAEAAIRPRRDARAAAPCRIRNCACGSWSGSIRTATPTTW